MAPQQRTALLSVVAATALVTIKLVVGLISHSLGLVAEAIHSGTDVVAALLTYLAVGVAVRPADPDHPFGHGKAEHLSALAEGGVLVVASFFIAYESIKRLASGGHPHVDAGWYVLAVLVVVIAIDATRALGSWRSARRYHSPALAGNALHFATDLVGSAAVLVGLLMVRDGHPGADSVAALLVAGLVLISAGRLMRTNVRVLMDTTPAPAEHLARDAIEAIEPAVDLRRLRIREAAGRHFADVVVGVEADTGVAQGHAIADAVEDAIHERLPGSDVVVHVEPQEGNGHASLRQRATAAALSVPEVREIHNVTVLEVGDRTELTLHIKLPSDMTLDRAHEIASRVEQAIRAAAPEVVRVQTHIEPLAEDTRGHGVAGGRIRDLEASVRTVVRKLTGRDPAELTIRQTDGGLVAFITLRMQPETGLVDAHSLASEIERRVHAGHAEIAEVVIHTEPA